ncbi:hypothetical protein [Saccharothrix sp. NRRL B-16348]|nr:hypothetical protein [Saccharothrix sp. NRRL B-16348]
MQEFGHREALQVTSDGQVREGYWNSNVVGELTEWAADNGFTVFTPAT